MESSGTAKFLLIFDVGQTLCYNCETYEEFVHNQVAAVYKVFIERLTVMPALDRHKLGLTSVPLVEISASPTEYETRFVAALSEAIVKFKDMKNAKYVGQEVGLDTQFISVLVEKDVFTCGLSTAALTQEQLQALQEFAKELLRDDKCVTAKYAAFDGLIPLLAQYKADPRFVLAICTNTSYAKKQRAIVHQCGLDQYFDSTVVSSEVGIRKPNPAILGILKKEYPQFKDYQICMIGDMIDRDIMCGVNANVRTVWFTQNQFDPAVNYKKLKDCKPDFTFSQYAQLPAIVNAMLRDAEFLQMQPEETQKNYRKPGFYRLLPSQQCLRVAYSFPNGTEREIIQQNGYAISNEKILYYPLQVKCPIEVQPEFAVLLHKAIDKAKIGEILASQKQKVVTVNPPEASELFTEKTKLVAKLEEALSDPTIVALQTKHGASLKLTMPAAADQHFEEKIKVTCLGKIVEVNGPKPNPFLGEIAAAISDFIKVPVVSFEFGTVGTESRNEYYLRDRKSVV